MIFLDTETTGLPAAGVEDPATQPRIIEIAAVSATYKWFENEARLVRRGDYSRLVNPGVKLDEKVIKITGITDADLEAAPPFTTLVPGLVTFFREDPDNVLVAHNLSFDLGMLVFELRRSGWEHRFPFCWHQIDTCDGVAGGKKLEKWATELGVLTAPQQHRAMADVELLMRCYEEYQRRNMP